MDNRNMRVSSCGCARCQAEGHSAEKQLHGHVNLLLSQLNEKQRRWLAALLAEQIGLSRGGVRQASQICGISEKTVRRGLKEFETGFADLPSAHIRRPGAGRRTRIRTAP